jgi:hypothetical protein
VARRSRRRERARDEVRHVVLDFHTHVLVRTRILMSRSSAMCGSRGPGVPEHIMILTYARVNREPAVDA